MRCGTALTSIRDWSLLRPDSFVPTGLRPRWWHDAAGAIDGQDHSADLPILELSFCAEPASGSRCSAGQASAVVTVGVPQRRRAHAPTPTAPRWLRSMGEPDRGVGDEDRVDDGADPQAAEHEMRLL